MTKTDALRGRLYEAMNVRGGCACGDCVDVMVKAAQPTEAEIEELAREIAGTLFGGEAAEWALPKVLIILRGKLGGTRP